MNKIKKITTLLVGMLPFVFGIFYGVMSMNSILGAIGVIILGMAGTLMIMGVFGEMQQDYGSGIMSVLSIPIGIIGGILLYLSYL